MGLASPQRRSFFKKLNRGVSIEKNKNASEVAWTRQSTLFARILLNYNPNPRFNVFVSMFLLLR